MNKNILDTFNDTMSDTVNRLAVSDAFSQNGSAILAVMEQMDASARKAMLEQEDQPMRDFLLQHAVTNTSMEVVQSLVEIINTGNDEQVQKGRNQIIFLAASQENGHVFFDTYLPQWDDTYAKRALLDAAHQGNVACIQSALAAGADPKADNSEALKTAAHSDRWEAVAVLAPISDCQAEQSTVFVSCAEFGHAKSLQQMLPFADPSIFNYALAVAATCGHDEVVDILYPHANAEVVVNHWEAQPEDTRPPLGHLLKRWRAEQANRVLSETLGVGGDDSAPTTSSKILL